jgi:hypothetical protein
VHLFVDAIQKSKIDPVKIMRLYSKVARIRLMSTDQVLNAAEGVGKRLFEAYERPPDDPAEALARYANGEDNYDPLREFTEACRLERTKALQQV